MLSKNILAKIRLIKIRTKRLLAGLALGDYRTKQKGYGLEFEQLNDYQLGHDIRFIDWKSSARAGKMLVKQYYEEKSRVVLIAVDVSQSSFFGSQYGTKYDINAELASIMTFVASYNNDLVGLILFDDSIELFIPPSKGRMHINSIVEKIFAAKPRNKRTSLGSMLHFVGALRKKDAILVIISDFIDQSFDKKLLSLALHHTIFAFRCRDAYELSIPDIGFLQCQDIETGEQLILDMRKSSTRQFSRLLDQIKHDQDVLFRKCGVHYMDICNSTPYINDVIRFFHIYK